MSNRVIVAATDGTGCGSAAVEWAAREAQRRRCSLRIVHAYEWDWHEARYGACQESVDVARSLAAAVVADAYERACAIAPRADVWTDTLIGPLLPRLLEMARSAELLVVGSRGRGGVAGMRSASRRVATHAAGPVVVVRERPTADRPVVAEVHPGTLCHPRASSCSAPSACSVGCRARY